MEGVMMGQFRLKMSGFYDIMRERRRDVRLTSRGRHPRRKGN